MTKSHEPLSKGFREASGPWKGAYVGIMEKKIETTVMGLCTVYSPP